VSYRYPDHGDRVTVALMSRGGLSHEEWEAQEAHVLSRLDDVLAGAPARTLLDYGSGLGRLALRYAGMFERVTAYEPDLHRADEQRRCVAGQPRVEVVTRLDDTAVGYDAVVCSHVIQHVRTDMVEPVVRDVVGRVRDGGHVLLITTLSPGPEPRFVIGSLDGDGAVVERPVSKQEFDAAVAGDPGQLPVHFFPYGWLLAACDAVGLEPVAAYGLHGRAGVVGPVTSETPELLACRDIALLARRR
jgi:SAM-dependent methyltransferase